MIVLGVRRIQVPWSLARISSLCCAAGRTLAAYGECSAKIATLSPSACTGATTGRRLTDSWRPIRSLHSSWLGGRAAKISRITSRTTVIATQLGARARHVREIGSVARCRTAAWASNALEGRSGLGAGAVAGTRPALRRHHPCGAGQPGGRAAPSRPGTPAIGDLFRHRWADLRLRPQPHHRMDPKPGTRTRGKLLAK